MQKSNHSWYPLHLLKSCLYKAFIFSKLFNFFMAHTECALPRNSLFEKREKRSFISKLNYMFWLSSILCSECVALWIRMVWHILFVMPCDHIVDAEPTMEETILVGDDLMMGPPSPIIPPEIASHVLEGVEMCDGILRNLFLCKQFLVWSLIQQLISHLIWLINASVL